MINFPSGLSLFDCIILGNMHPISENSWLTLIFEFITEDIFPVSNDKSYSPDKLDQSKWQSNNNLESLAENNMNDEIEKIISIKT